MPSRLVLLTLIVFACMQSKANEVNSLSRPERAIAAVADGDVRILLQRRKSSHLKSNVAFLGEVRSETRVSFHHLRGAAGEIEVLEPESALTHSAAQDVIKKLQARPDIQYAAIDTRRHPHAIPSDSLYSNQWYLQSDQPSAIAANLAWDITTGSSGTIVAVLDTGVRFDHPDLQRAAQAGKLLPGFDFVSSESSGSFFAANDGDGWDPDPSDPGDWIDSTDQQKPQFSKCTIEGSSWHGTRVAGLIGAASNNGIGIAGASWSTYILPVRVLGKCGGYDSDILQAMRWAAGLHVSGVPDNPYPAKILNLSFGSAGDPCSYQSVIQELSALGVLIVVSAGNEGGPVDAPANCPGVVGVAGLRHAGTKVGYSSLGPEISLSAPAGNCVNTSGACLFSLTTTYDIGTTTPAGSDYTTQFKTNLGTSFSAPLAAGVAALMHSVNGKLSAYQLRARMMESALPFPNDKTISNCHVPANKDDQQTAECNCTTSTCGAGMLNANTAVSAAQRPIVSISAPSAVTGGNTLTLDGAVSSAACNRSIASYKWSVINTSGTSTPTMSADDQSAIQVAAPTSGSYTLRLTVTDNQGAIDTGDVTITSTSIDNATSSTSNNPACPASLVIAQTPTTPTTQPTPQATTQASDGKSGGGMFGILFIALLSSVEILRRMRVGRSNNSRVNQQY